MSSFKRTFTFLLLALLFNSMAPPFIKSQEHPNGQGPINSPQSIPSKPYAESVAATPAETGTTKFLKKIDKRGKAGKDYVPEEVLVKFKENVSAENIATLKKNLGGTKGKKIGRTRLHQLKVRPGLSVDEAIKEYRNRPEVEYVQPNYIYYPAATFPDDTDFSNLWGLDNSGQIVNGTSGTSGADIDAPEAWDLNTGSPSVTVAVLDTGIDYNHPDISSNLWSNGGETAANATDDDGNGYIDDVRGWDFVDDDNDPMDIDGHGTHVSGTIGAEGNNGIGITGVSWAAEIMPIRVCGVEWCTSADMAAGIDYAVDNGARIINMSLSTSPGGKLDQAVLDAIDAANLAGVLLAVAAGNDSNNNDLSLHAGGGHVYPSDYTYPNIISVAATDQDDALAPFSNYGATSVDVGAPGTNIYSLKPARETVFSEDFESGAAGWTWTTNSGNRWTRSDVAAHDGTYGLTDGSGAFDYPMNYDAGATSPDFSLFGKSGCELSFWTDYSIEHGYDLAYVQASTDGSSFTDLDVITDTSGGWVLKRYYLGPYEGNAYVSLRFWLTTDGATNDAGIFVDDIKVTCSSDVYSGTEYEYMGGTSMAAPHVAGLAALLLADNPSLTVEQLKYLILDQGDSVPALAGKTVSGKRINAYQSLLASASPSFNNPPVLDPVGDKTVDELTLLSFTATALDVNLPAENLTFSLAGSVPAGASISPGGDFTWTPTEAQGPGLYSFDVVVTDDGTPNFSDSERITVTVDEVNIAPVITGQSPLYIVESTPYTVPLAKLTVTDPDVIYPAGFSLTAAAGTNYTSDADTITPTPGYFGPLTVPVTVNDGSAESPLYDLQITVLIDSDNDGFADIEDICAGLYDSPDSDADGIPDWCDVCSDSWPIRIGEVDYWQGVQWVYDNELQSGETILVQRFFLNGPLVLNQAKDVTIHAGWQCDFTGKGAYDGAIFESLIIGSQSGTVTLDHITF